MVIKTLAELQEADERTLCFSPYGLGGRMRPEDAAEYQQQVIARHELSEAVTEGTRQTFEQLREICAYGVHGSLRTYLFREPVTGPFRDVGWAAGSRSG